MTFSAYVLLAQVAICRCTSRQSLINSRENEVCACASSERCPMQIEQPLLIKYHRSLQISVSQGDERLTGPSNHYDRIGDNTQENRQTKTTARHAGLACMEACSCWKKSASAALLTRTSACCSDNWPCRATSTCAAWSNEAQGSCCTR